MDYDKYEALKVDNRDGIVTITIDRPEARNAINAALHTELGQVFLDVDDDPECKVIVLTGAGDSFCAGGDLNWLLKVHGDPVATSSSIRVDRRIQNALLDLEKPIIAKVKGPAIGLGCSLALFCDFVYATPSSKFADPHVAVGLVAGDGGALLWPQLIGYARARRYLLTGDPISGDEAAEIGLITAAIADDVIDEEVSRMAVRLSTGSTYAVRWTKSSINAGLKVMANVIIDRAAAYENITQLMNDHRIALVAFGDKRAPEFIGS